MFYIFFLYILVIVFGVFGDVYVMIFEKIDLDVSLI